MYYTPNGFPTFPDHRAAALDGARLDCLRDQATLAIADLDARTAALTTLYGANHRPPGIEIRAAADADVDTARRIITVVAVPYEQPADVLWREEWWREVFARGAFTGVEAEAGKVRVNRDHDRTRTVGKVDRFDPNHTAGLLAEIRIAATTLGDETLALADADCLSASVGFGVRPGGQELIRSTMTRRVTRAFLNHLSLVEQPAYGGAKVIGVAS